MEPIDEPETADDAAHGMPETEALTPRFWSFALSDLTVICGWALVAAVYFAEPESLRDIIARPTNLTVGIATVLAIASVIALASMIYRRVAPKAFALELDATGMRWRNPYFAFWVHRHRWIDIDLFHAPRSIANVGTARYFKKKSVLTVMDRPSPFDRSLPSNYGFLAEEVAEHLEERRLDAVERMRSQQPPERKRRNPDRGERAIAS